MLQLAAPLGLLALGALAAPLLIHLVRRPRQVVRLGSLKFLHAERRSVRSVRWHELRLLAVRCALLAALAFLLAGLYWQRPPSRWLLRLPDALLEAATLAEWDRLAAEGFEARDLAPGFPLAKRPDSLSPIASSPASPDVWSLLREADLRLPAGSIIHVFGPPLTTYFRGTRPTLDRVEVKWHATPFSPPAPITTPRDPAPLTVAVVAGPNRQDDARYVRAMLTALGARFETATPAWIFQLGGEPLPDALQERIRQGATLVVDAVDARATPVTRVFDAGATGLHLRQRTPAGPGASLLLDSAGEPLLTQIRSGQGQRWQFALRFHPDWSDWTTSTAFPAWWRSQFSPPSVGPALVSPDQATPSLARSASSAPSLLGLNRIDWRLSCWIAAVLLFALERWWSLIPQRRPQAA